MSDASEGAGRGFLTRRRMMATSAVLASPRSAFAQPAQPLHDLTPAFWRIYDAGRGSLGGAARAKSLAAGFFGPERAIYARAGIKRVSPRGLALWLAEFDGLAPAARRLSRTFPEAWRAHLVGFRTAFPDFAARAPVFALMSLFRFDGHGENGALFFGLDGVAKFHGADPNLKVLLDHEAFHLYHAQVSPAVVNAPGDPIWSGLWTEGLATYVSRRLNPDASRLSVLLDDRPLAEAPPALARRVAEELLGRLNSGDPKLLTRYFSAGYSGDIPARSGYLVGMMAVARAGEGMIGLRHLAKMPPAQVRAVLADELKAIVRG